MGKVNFLLFRTKQLMEKSKENQNAPHRENDIHAVGAMGKSVMSLVGQTPKGRDAGSLG